MSASTVDLAVRAICTQLAALADALGRGDATAIEASDAVMSSLVDALRGAAEGAGEAVSAELVTEALWQVQRCRRLGATLVALSGVGVVTAGTSTYLSTGTRPEPPPGLPSLEVTA